MVESLILSPRWSFDFPFEARIRIGTGDEGADSGMGGSVVIGDDVDGGWRDT